MRRRLIVVLLTVAAVLIPMSANAHHSLTHPGRVRVVEVSGYIDPVMSDFLSDAIHASELARDEVLLLQLNSNGVLIGKNHYQELLGEVRNAKVPIAVWVGGVGSKATNGAEQLARAGDILGMAPATSLEVNGQRISAKQAIDRDIAAFTAPVLQQFIFLLDDRVVGGRTVQTANSTSAQQENRELTTRISFSKPSLMGRLLHTAASPSIAYMFLMAGLLLLVFEFFALGIGVAAASGLLLLLPSTYGLAVLPTQWWALVLIAFGVAGFTIDIQSGASRVWTVLGAIALTIGSLNLYDGISLPLLTFVPIFALTIVFAIAAMPATIRARFATPAIGRDWMKGQIAIAVSELDPNGIIELQGARWPARTNRATPIAVGESARVLSIEGVVVEVEPETGGARDYRDHGSRIPASD